MLTGSYDATVRLFDTRSGQCEMIMGSGVRNRSENAPVEQVLMFPSGTVALSAAGPILRVWDIVAGGRCTRALSNHQKTVTALTFNANANRLLTGSLDQMVKVYDVSSYKVVHTMRYPAPLLCLAISVCYFFSELTLTPHHLKQPDETHILGGMSDGTLSVRRRQPKGAEVQEQVNSSDIYVDIPGVLNPVARRSLPKATNDAGELRMVTQPVKKLKEYDKLLKAFKYSAALDSVLKKVLILSTIAGFFLITFIFILERAAGYNFLPNTRTHTSRWTEDCLSRT